MRDGDLVIITKGEYAGRHGVIAETTSPHFDGTKHAVWVGNPPTIAAIPDDALILRVEVCS